MEYLHGNHIYGDDLYVDDYYMDEIWMPIKGFVDYAISDKGRVWSRKSQYFVKPKRMDKQGHLGVSLCKDGQRYYKYIHRLIAEHFISNPNNLPIVRHLNDCPLDNEIDNLAWGTQYDNVHDCIKNGNSYKFTSDDRRKGYINRMTPIMARDVKTNKKLYFESQGEASRVLNIPQSNIWKVLKGERHTAGGYTFEEVIYETY